MSEKAVRVPKSRRVTVPPAPASLAPSEIAARAYELFLRRGCTHGHDWEDWLAAERELAVFAPDAATPAGEPAVTLRPRQERRRPTRRRASE